MASHPQQASTLYKGVIFLIGTSPRIGSQCILLGSICAFTSFQAPISWLEVSQPRNCSYKNVDGDTSGEHNRLHEACRNNGEGAEVTSLHSSPQSREFSWLNRIITVISGNLATFKDQLFYLGSCSTNAHDGDYVVQRGLFSMTCLVYNGIFKKGVVFVLQWLSIM